MLKITKIFLIFLLTLLPVSFTKAETIEPFCDSIVVSKDSPEVCKAQVLKILYEKLAMLQQELVKLQGTSLASTTPSTSNQLSPLDLFTNQTPLQALPDFYIFPRDLDIGSQGEDVRELQKFLNSAGYTVSISGLGSPGRESDVFDEKTRLSLMRYQVMNGITTEYGKFGPLTRKLINAGF